MIHVKFSRKCLELMDILGLSRDQVVTTVNDRHRGLVSDGLNRIVAAHWYAERQFLLVDSIVTRRHHEPEQQRCRFDEVLAQVVLDLHEELPCGHVDQRMSIEKILATIAESFGCPVTCHPDEPPTALYAGPWDGGAVHVSTPRTRSPLYVSGSFYPYERRCELVWALDFDRYRNWLQETSKAHPALLSRLSTYAPPPSEYRFERAPVPALTLEYLLGFARAFPSLQPSIRPTSEAVQYYLAATVLRAFLGDSWCDQQLLDTDRSHGRFREKGRDLHNRLKAQSWTVALAEMLFNLQDVPGFSGRLKRLGRADLESVVAELEAARLLSLSSVPFRFVDDDPTKARNFDMEVFLRSGRTACCETKAKMPNTPLRDRTIQTSLKAAASQLLRSVPGIIFLRLPEVWIRDPRVETTVRHAIRRFFQSHRRVILVIVFWEEWHDIQQTSIARVARFKEIVNAQSRFYDPADTRLLRDYPQLTSNRKWWRFAEVVALCSTKPAS